MRWAAAELHAHTVHSDGTMSPEQLLKAADARKLDYIALTDHNTQSGIGSLPFLPGTEWTAYRGHMTVLGAKCFVDWRKMEDGPLDPLLREIRRAEGAAVIAHPFDVGSPVCTGCRWEYEVLDPGLISAVEIWNGERPWEKRESEKSLSFWHSLLDGGHRIAAVCGLDWHHAGEERNAAVTCLGIQGPPGVENALDALRAARTLVTAGPVPDLSVTAGGRSFGIGDTVPPGRARVRVLMDTQARRGVWSGLHILLSSARLVTSGGAVLAEKPFSGAEAVFDLALKPGWVSLECLGTVADRPCRIAVASPFYVRFPTFVTAHAGAMGTAPNTLGSLETLLASGADAVEVDVREKGGELVLSHDPVLPWQKPAGLRDALRLLREAPGILMNLDLKESGLSEKALLLAREHGVASRLLFTGDVGEEDFPVILGGEVPLWLNEYLLPAEERKDPVPAAERRGFGTLNIDRKRLTDGLLASHSAKLSVWTVNGEDELRRLLASGVRNITTRDPALALRLREEIQGA